MRKGMIYLGLQVEQTVKGVSNEKIREYIILISFFYALFAFDRIKKTFAFTVEGFTTSNQIWMIPLLLIILLIVSLASKRLVIRKEIIMFLCIISLYFSVLLIGGFNASSYSHYLYALLLFFVPILLYILTSSVSIKSLKRIIYVILYTSLIYAILAIILTNNYSFFMNFIGNELSYEYYSHYRASMMIGSSIVVSYYFNLTLPLLFYLFYESKKSKTKFVTLISIIVNIIATLLLLSRLASIIAILICLSYLFIMALRRGTIIKTSIISGMITIGVGVSIITFDLSRILMGFGSEGATIEGRMDSIKLGLSIFYDAPLFGSGVGSFFERVYESREISYQGISGLIDPHNMYIMALSESGILGVMVLLFLFIFLFKTFRNIRKDLLRYTAYITLFVFLLGGLGGSHIFININYSIIFWIYMGVFTALSYTDKYKRQRVEDSSNNKGGIN